MNEPGWEFSQDTGEPPTLCNKCHDHSESGRRPSTVTCINRKSFFKAKIDGIDTKKLQLVFSTHTLFCGFLFPLKMVNIE